MALHDAATRAGVGFVAEGFADRAYLPTGRLVPRTEAGAVIDDVAQVSERAVRMARDGVVRAIDGSDVAVQPQSVCLHGDTPGAVELARAVRSALADAGLDVRAFTG